MFVCHSYNLLDFFFLFFLVFVLFMNRGLKNAAYGIHSTGGQVFCGGKRLKCRGEEKNGLYDDVTVRHPSSIGVTDCTSTTVLFTFFQILLSSLFCPQSPWILFMFGREKKQTAPPFLNIYFSNPSKNPSDGGERKVNLFWFCLILLLLLMIIPHSLF